MNLLGWISLSTICRDGQYFLVAFGSVGVVLCGARWTVWRQCWSSVDSWTLCSRVSSRPPRSAGGLRESGCSFSSCAPASAASSWTGTVDLFSAYYSSSCLPASRWDSRVHHPVTFLIHSDFQSPLSHALFVSTTFLLCPTFIVICRSSHWTSCWWAWPCCCSRPLQLSRRACSLWVNTFLNTCLLVSSGWDNQSWTHCYELYLPNIP